MSTVDFPRNSVDLVLPHNRLPAAHLLELVADAVAGVDGDPLVNLQVVVAQLVANSYRHAAAPRRLRLCRLPDRDLVRVEVDDGSPSRLPVLGRFDTLANGRGLLMVNRLSVNWGHRSGADGKTVWAEVPLV
ncbi:ATP-binding protein [Saccharothrix isguenensis]